MAPTVGAAPFGRVAESDAFEQLLLRSRSHDYAEADLAGVLPEPRPALEACAPSRRRSRHGPANGSRRQARSAQAAPLQRTCLRCAVPRLRRRIVRSASACAVRTTCAAAGPAGIAWSLSGSDEPMRAIILNAGRGSRMAAHTDEMPKCLIQNSGSTILDQQLHALARAGCNSATVIGGYRIDKLAAHLRRAEPSLLRHDHGSCTMTSRFYRGDTLEDGMEFLMRSGPLAFLETETHERRGGAGADGRPRAAGRVADARREGCDRASARASSVVQRAAHGGLGVRGVAF